MRKQLLASASAVGLMFFAGGIANSADIYQEPAAVMPDASATVSLWLGGFFPSGYKRSGGSNDNDFKDNAFGFGGDARGVYNFDNPGWALQFELMGLGHGSTRTGDSDEKDKMAAHLATGVHLINRRDGWSWGGYGALTHSSHVEDDEDSQHVALGLEAAGHFGDATIFGQFGGVWNIGKTTCGTDAIDSGWMGRFGGRYFWQQNTKLEASIAGGSGEETSSGCGRYEPDDWRWFQFAAELEHKFASNPFSIFAAYGGDWVKSDEKGPWPNEETWVHSLRIGARMSFGAQTLREQELYGAETFKFGQWAAPFMYLDELD